MLWTMKEKVQPPMHMQQPPPIPARLVVTINATVALPWLSTTLPPYGQAATAMLLHRNMLRAHHIACIITISREKIASISHR